MHIIINFYTICKINLEKIKKNYFLFKYFHGAYDLMAVEDHQIIRRDIHGRLLRLSIELQMSIYKADKNVRNLLVSGRKCLFRDEKSLKYFQVLKYKYNFILI